MFDRGTKPWERVRQSPGSGLHRAPVDSPAGKPQHERATKKTSRRGGHVREHNNVGRIPSQIYAFVLDGANESAGAHDRGGETSSVRSAAIALGVDSGEAYMRASCTGPRVWWHNLGSHPGRRALVSSAVARERKRWCAFPPSGLVRSTGGTLGAARGLLGGSSVRVPSNLTTLRKR